MTLLESEEPECIKGVAIRCIILDAAILESEVELDVYGTDDEAAEPELLRAVCKKYHESLRIMHYFRLKGDESNNRLTNAT